MAKTNNKYTSINFNHIYNKNPAPNSKSSANNQPARNPFSSSSFASASSYPSISSPHKPHGRMLVLTRNTHAPASTPAPASKPIASQLQSSHARHQIPDQTASNLVSLRPLGPTGVGSAPTSSFLGLERDKEISQVLTSPKPNKFVPPHRRPGFVGKEEKPEPEVIRSREASHRQQQGYSGSPGRFGEDGRPKSGGGYADSGMMMMYRPTSRGSRPNSSG